MTSSFCGALKSTPAACFAFPAGVVTAHANTVVVVLVRMLAVVLVVPVVWLVLGAGTVVVRMPVAC